MPFQGPFLFTGNGSSEKKNWPSPIGLFAIVPLAVPGSRNKWGLVFVFVVFIDVGFS